MRDRPGRFWPFASRRASAAPLLPTKPASAKVPSVPGRQGQKPSARSAGNATSGSGRSTTEKAPRRGGYIIADFSGVFSMMELARNSSLGNECYQAEGRVTGWVRGEPPICASLIRGAGLMAGRKAVPPPLRHIPPRARH